MDNAYKDKEDIRDVLLIGGSAPIPCVQSKLKEIFEDRELDLQFGLSHCNDLVAYGAAIMAKRLSQSKNAYQIVNSGEKSDSSIEGELPVSR